VADKEDACTNSKRNCGLRTEFFVYLIRSEVTSAAVSLKTRDYAPVLSTSRVILCGYWHHFLCSFETIPRYPERHLSARTPLTYAVIAYWSYIVHLNSYRWKYGQNIHYPATYTDLPELRTCNCTSLRRDVRLVLSLSTQPNFRGGYVAIIWSLLSSTFIVILSLSLCLWLRSQEISSRSTKKNRWILSFHVSCRKSYKGLHACLHNSSIIKYTGNDTETRQVKSDLKEWDFHYQINSKLSLLRIHYK